MEKRKPDQPNKPKARTKLVVRNLPPELTQEKFSETIQEYQSSYDYLDYRPGKKTAKKKESGYCFINFIDADALLKFFIQFSNHSFVDEKGNRYKISIEYSPYQGIPKDSKSESTSSREGTILNDEDYLQFVEKLSAPRVMLPSAEVQLEKRLAEESKLAAASPGGVAPPIISPLVAELRAKKERQAAQKSASLQQKKKPVRRRKPKTGEEKKSTEGGQTGGSQAAPVVAKKILLRNPASGGNSVSAPNLSTPNVPVTQPTTPPQTTPNSTSGTPANQQNKPYRNRNKKQRDDNKPAGGAPNSTGGPASSGSAPNVNKPNGAGRGGRGGKYGGKPKQQANSKPGTPVVTQPPPPN